MLIPRMAEGHPLLDHSKRIRVRIGLPRKRLRSTPTLHENYYLYAYVRRQLPPAPSHSTATTRSITATVLVPDDARQQATT